MAEPREITYPIRLSVPEFAALLTIVEAERLVGIEDGELFPAGQVPREELWNQGRAELEADGWLVRNEETNQYRINNQLVLIVATVADPQLVVLSKWEDAEGRHSVIHTLSSDLVVELGKVGDEYHLTALEAEATMAARLANVFGLQNGQVTNASFELSREQAAQVKDAPDAHRLTSYGLPALTAAVFANSTRDKVRSGSVTLLRVQAERALTMRMIGVIVAADGLAWFAAPVDDERVRYVAGDAHMFKDTIADLVAELREVAVEA